MNSDFFFFFQAEDGIRDKLVTGVQTCALPICSGLPDHDQEIASAMHAFFIERLGRDHANLDIDAASRLLHASLTTSEREQVRRSEERRVGKECRSRWSPYN